MERRYDAGKVITTSGQHAGSFYLLPPEMEEVLRTFTPEAHDSDVIIDVTSGTYYFVMPDGSRGSIKPDDVRAVVIKSMNLPGHGPIYGDY